MIINIQIEDQLRQAIVINRLKYVLDFLTHHPLNTSKCPFILCAASSNSTVFYGKNPNQSYDYQIGSQELFFTASWNSNTLFANAYKWNDFTIYSVESVQKEAGPFCLDSRFQFDIFETIFFHISRFEEYFASKDDLDRYQRFKTSHQFLVKHQLEKIPVVDHLVYAFFASIGIPTALKNTTISITHDIDEIKKFSTFPNLIRKTGGLLLRERKIQPVLKLWQSYQQATQLNGKDPYDVFEWMLTSSEKIRSKVIYFLVGGQAPQDSPYPLDQRFDRAVKEALEKDYNIGIHPSFDSYNNYALLEQEKSKLESAIDQPVFYSRQHFLRFSIHTTPQLLDQLNIQNDSTLGYNDRIGFRCGTGFPYHLYDFKQEKSFRFVETPMVFMDFGLFLEGSYKPDKIVGLWNQFLDLNQQLTHLTYNIHNSRFDDAWLKGIPLQQLYLELIKR